MIKFQYKCYSAEYKRQIIDLLGILWKFPREDREKYFKWKYEDNPYTISPLGFVALDGEKVVAFRGYMAIPVRIKDTVWLNAQLADTVTHPDYRRMGLFQSITQFSLEELEKDKRFLVSLNSSSGGPTVGGYLKLGWQPFSEREHLFHFTFKGIMNRLRKRDIVWPLGAKKYGIYTIKFDNICKVGDITSIQYEYNRLSHLRDEEFYKWRLNNPHSVFRYAYLYDDLGMLLSFMICVDLGNGRYDIIDFNYSKEKYLKMLVKGIYNNVSPLYLTLWTVGKTNVIYRNHKNFGLHSLSFILNRFKKFQKPPFLIRGIGDDGEEKLNDANLWDLYKIIADEI